MLLCSLLDKLFLKNPPAKGALSFMAESQGSRPALRRIRSNPYSLMQKKKPPSSEKDEKEGVILRFAPKEYRNSKPVQACCFLFCVIE